MWWWCFKKPINCDFRISISFLSSSQIIDFCVFMLWGVTFTVDMIFGGLIEVMKSCSLLQEIGSAEPGNRLFQYWVKQCPWIPVKVRGKICHYSMFLHSRASHIKVEKSMQILSSFVIRSILLLYYPVNM